ncbi:cytochrome P450 6B6-like [Anticarsia gemmatalis]|uniref:cytochrome P450 6B6-like n=1 Tax=Anticarsia gemmatalis TaxID=129554 RepID=UPI003F777F9C
MFFESFLLNLSVLVILIFALIFDYITKFFSYWYVRHVPYKTSVPFFGSDYHRVLGIRNSTQDVNTLYNQYPKEKFVGRVKSRIPDLIVKDPDSIKRMLSTDFANFHSRGLSLDKSQDVCLRDNLFYADGEKWTLLREGYESLLRNVNCELESLSDCLPGTNGDVNAQEILSKVLDKVFEDLLLGNAGGSVVKNLRSVAQRRTIIERFKTYLKNVFPSLYVTFGLTTLFGEPSTKTKSEIEKSVLLSKIKNLGNVYQLGIKEKNKKRSDVEFAFSVVASFITEGYIPCLNALTAFLYELALNSQVQERCRNSVSKDNREEYLDVAVKEILRLHPPYSIISRQCMKTYHPEGGMLIDRKVTINVPVEALHRDEEHYVNAEVFNPDRFLDDKGASKHCYAYLPFGAGPRKCIGEQLALNIIKNVSRAILKKFNIEPCDKTPSNLTMADHNFARVVDRDIWLRFQPRV